MRLSIVATMFRSSRYVAEFCHRATLAAQQCCDDFEIVLVNDGSPDDSLHRALSLGDSRVVVVDLSRNFGHHPAMLCGLRHARGERVFLIDIDLEEPPENLERFWRYQELHPEVDVVEGQVESKPGGVLRRLSGAIFYKVFNSLSPLKISDRAMVSRLMSRAYVDALISYQEADPFLPAIWVDAGFVQHAVPAKKHFDGSTTYSVRRRIRMALHAIASFSSMPLIYLFYVGAVFSGGALCFVAYLGYQRIFGSEAILPGWSSVIAALFFIGGIVIFSNGLLGIYVAKIYKDVKGRPGTIVRKVYRPSGGNA